jgi:hypothetical protein
LVLHSLLMAGAMGVTDVGELLLPSCLLRADAKPAEFLLLLAVAMRVVVVLLDVALTVVRFVDSAVAMEMSVGIPAEARILTALVPQTVWLPLSSPFAT